MKKDIILFVITLVIIAFYFLLSLFATDTNTPYYELDSEEVMLLCLKPIYYQSTNTYLCDIDMSCKVNVT